MNRKILWLCFAALVPCLAFAAARDGVGRVGVRGAASSVAATPKTQAAVRNPIPVVPVAENNLVPEESVVEQTKLDSDACRDAYRECMDEFCQLDESEGGRCSCSDNIKQSKTLIQDIQTIQQEAEKLYTEGVEKERLGAKAKFVQFGESDRAKKSSRASGIDLVAWINGTGSASLSADDEIGDNLYALAAESCEYVLTQCDENRAMMEERLYQREIVKDCKAFDGYLTEQKTAAESNKRTAEAAVRSARAEMLAVTNKYRRDDCLTAIKVCVSDKGGCGVNYENCLDADLLMRRANSCESVLDQCMAVRDIVLDDWKAEIDNILARGEKYVDEHMRMTCRAKIRNCLEEGCSASIGLDNKNSAATSSACLSNINVAANICPIINECNEKIPGIKNEVQAELAELRTSFCQNDIDKCLRDKCGSNFTAPECLGKKTSDITALCPKSRFASCKDEKQFDLLVSAVLLQMDYQMLEGCKNYFANELGRVCGTDMNCLPKSDIVESLRTLPSNEDDLRVRVRAESKKAVDEFFKRFDNEATIAACKSAQQPNGSGRRSLKDSVFLATKMVAEIGAQNRYMADLESKILQLKRADARVKSRDACLTTYKVETKPNDTEENPTYSYIKSVSFEASLCNCHVCRMQRVCETGGESKWTSAAKGAFGGITSGASIGTMAYPGYGTAIGAGLFGIAGGLLGAASGGEKDFCQEIESCEDIDVSDVEGGCRGEN